MATGEALSLRRYVQSLTPAAGLPAGHDFRKSLQLGKPAQIVAAIVVFAILGKLTDWLIEIAAAPLLRWQDAFGRQGEAN